MLLFLLPDFYSLLRSAYVGQMGFFETNKQKFFFLCLLISLLLWSSRCYQDILRGLPAVFVVSQPWLLCLLQSTSSSLIPLVVPIHKRWITSSTCNTVSKTKGDRAKGSYGFMLSPGGMGTRAEEREEVLDDVSTNVLLHKAGLVLFIQSVWNKIGP